jgi:hypothetical protein
MGYGDDDDDEGDDGDHEEGKFELFLHQNYARSI